MATTMHTNYCRICVAACGVQVEVDDGRIVAVHGDREHPLSEGYLCVKGRASKDLHNGEDRLASTRRRLPDGIVEDIDIETALDEIHDRLASIVDYWGPDSVALYYGTGINTNTLTHSAMKAWIAGLGSPYIFSSMTLDQSAKWVTMGRMGFYLGGKRNVYDADVLLMVGSNPAVSHGSMLFPNANPMKWVRQGRDKGLKLIVVDPRETETAREADIHVRVRAGEDACLFAGLIHIVLDCELQDREFCERFVGPLDALRSAVAGFTPEFVSERTGVPVDTLVEVATLFATSARKSAASGTGPNMSTDSNVAEHLIEALNVICGGYRRAGDKAWNTGGLYGSTPAMSTVLPPTRSWEHGRKLRTADIGAIAGEYPTSLLPDEILHLGDSRIRALVVVGGDLARAMPDPETTLAALDRLELLVTVDHRPTDTGARSDYEIATSLSYERHDLTGVLEMYFSRTFAQAVEPLVERPPGIIDDWEFFWGLARRAGTPMRMKQALFGVHHDDIPGDAFELDPETPTTTEDIMRWMCGLGGLTYDALLANPHGIAPEHDTVIAAVPDDGARLDVCAPDVAAEIAAVHARRPGHDDEYPLRLICRRMRGAMNSAFRKAGMVARHTPYNPAYLSPQDMAALGLEDEAEVRVESNFGSIMARARADDSLPVGTVAITHAWGPLVGDDGEAGSSVNQLISLTSDRQPINYMPRLSAVPVRLTAVSS